MYTVSMLRKKFIFIVLIAVIVSSPLSAQILDRTVAVVRLERTVNIGTRALNRQVGLFEAQLGRELNSEERREVLESMINDELIAQAAARAGIEISDSQLQQFIDQERQGLGPSVTQEQFQLLVEQQIGLSFDDYVAELRKQLLQQRYIQETQRQRLENIPEPGQNEIRRVFNENRSEFINPALVRFRHLYIDTRNMNETERNEAAARLGRVWGATSQDQQAFERLFGEASSSSEYDAADFGYMPQNDRQIRQIYGSEFVDTAFELDVNEVSGVVRSSIGVHVMQVTDSRPPRFLELDDELFPGQQVTVRQNIISFLMNERLQSEFQQAGNEALRALRDEAEITVNESRL